MKTLIAFAALVVAAGQLLIAGLISMRTVKLQTHAAELTLESMLSTYDIGMKSLGEGHNVVVNNNGTRPLRITIASGQSCILAPGEDLSQDVVGPWPMRIHISDPILPITHTYTVRPGKEQIPILSSAPSRTYDGFHS